MPAMISTIEQLRQQRESLEQRIRAKEVKNWAADFASFNASLRDAELEQ